MKILAIELYEYDLTYAHGTYAMSKGRSARQQPSNLVRVVTDDGIEGWGEAATLSGNYLPVFAAGTRAALRELAPLLIGQDPRRTSHLQRLMSSVLMGQANAKNAFDVACWDIFGKSVGLPIAELIGGVLSTELPIFEAVPLSSVEDSIAYVQKRSAEGILRYQIKIGDDPARDAARARAIAEAFPEIFFFVDANAGYTLLEAQVAMRALDDTGMFFEQPCRELADCALLRRTGRLPMIMDETVLNHADLYRAKYEVSAAAVNIKLGRLGGITPTVALRNAAQDLGMHFAIEDVWGGDVTSAAVSHVAASSSPEHLLHTSFFNDWTNEHVAGYQPRSRNGRGAAPTGPGLGITVDRALLGAPVASFP
ncbi:mandelate racemase/muconate lactonizing enzyme family protein [Paracoccus sp. pheM1]|uniref:mandelate racemase/muconate lactonizing enzyme family protein n=1 Tax=Paracoccus sp. pheM1 TaxID=2831675 RepID=UPI001BDB7A53|nr:mandelate racemase/muconate lactonizing enzyme family protein [Paracoccus sp. pheM1]MBT0782317.1 mandelate racemase/muconate lactonizing enzyme family protein [Paracoccus sp. pheM1]